MKTIKCLIGICVTNTPRFVGLCLLKEKDRQLRASHNGTHQNGAPDPIKDELPFAIQCTDVWGENSTRNPKVLGALGALHTAHSPLHPVIPDVSAV